jgi:hypothetical protein
MSESSSSTDRLHNVKSAAEFLGGLTPGAIYKWLQQGRLTRVKVGSRTMVYESELRALIKPQPPRIVWGKP